MMTYGMETIKFTIKSADKQNNTKNCRTNDARNKSNKWYYKYRNETKRNEDHDYIKELLLYRRNASWKARARESSHHIRNMENCNVGLYSGVVYERQLKEGDKNKSSLENKHNRFICILYYLHRKVFD